MKLITSRAAVESSSASPLTATVQVYDVFGALSPAVALWTGLAAARLTLAAESSALLEHPPNVLVATPGRLMAHCKAAQPAFSLTSLRFLVSFDKVTCLLVRPINK